MHIAIRTYYGKDNKKLFAFLEKHQAEVEAIMHSIEGIVSYTLAQNRDGGFSVTVCKDKRGINKSIKLKRQLIANLSPDMSLVAMHIIEGAVITLI